MLGWTTDIDFNLMWLQLFTVHHGPAAHGELHILHYIFCTSNVDLGNLTKQKLGRKTGSRHLGIILGKIEIDEVVEDKVWGWGAVWSQDAELYPELPILIYRSSQAHQNSVQCHGYSNLKSKAVHTTTAHQNAQR